MIAVYNLCICMKEDIYPFPNNFKGDNSTYLGKLCLAGGYPFVILLTV